MNLPYCKRCGYDHLQPGLCPRGASDWGGVSDGLRVYSWLIFGGSIAAGLWALLVTP